MPLLAIVDSLLLSAWFVGGLWFFKSEEPSPFKTKNFLFFILSSVLATTILLTNIIALPALVPILCSSMVLIIAYDLKEFYIPDFCSIYLIPFVLTYNFIKNIPTNFFESIFVSGIVLCLCLILKKIFSSKDIEDGGFGTGDIYLLILLSLVFGFDVFGIIATSSLSSLIYFLISKKRIAPFGAFLALISLLKLAFF